MISHPDQLDTQCHLAVLTINRWVDQRKAQLALWEPKPMPWQDPDPTPARGRNRLWAY